MHPLAIGQEVEIEIQAPSAGGEVLAAVLGSVVMTEPAPISSPFDEDDDEGDAKARRP